MARMNNLKKCLWCGMKEFKVVAKRKDSINVLECTNCGLKQLEKIPDELVRVYYDDEYFDGKTSDISDTVPSVGYHNYHEVLLHSFLWQQAFLKLITEESKGELLDVGCASGKFLELAEMAGFSPIGIDISPNAIRLAKIKGFSVFCGSLEQLQAENEKFDVITAWDFIEHIINLKEFLNECKRLLKPNGVLIFSTPDAGAKIVKERGDQWIGYISSLEHISFFTSDFLGRAFKEVFQTEPQIYSFTYDEYSTLVGYIRKSGLTQHDKLIDSYLRDSTYPIDIQTESEEIIFLSILYTYFEVDINKVQKVIELLELTAPSPKTYFLKSLIYLKQGKYQDAIYLLRNLSKVNRRDSLIWQVLIEALQQESSNLWPQLKDKTDEVANLQGTMAGLESKIESKNIEVSQLHENVSDLESQLKDKIEEVINLRGTMAGLESQLKDKTDEVANLQGTMAGLESKIESKNIEVSQLHENVSDLESQLKDKIEEVINLRGTMAGLESQLKDKNDEVANLQGTMAGLESQIEIKNLEIGELKEILRQRESSLSWRFSQFYGRYFSMDSRITRFISYVLNKIVHSREHTNVAKTEETKYYKQELESILKNHEGKVKGIVVYPPTVDWNIPLFQRPQQLALTLSKLGYLFFFSTGANTYDKVDGFQKLEDGCYLTNQYNLLVKELPEFIYLISSTNLVITINQIQQFKDKAFILYEYIDEISEDISGASVTQIINRHKYMLKNADIIIPTAGKLLDDVMEQRKEDAFLIPNGVDYEHFHIQRDQTEIPDDIKSIVRKGNPIIGYYGALATWFDYELVKELARRRPNYEIMLIGWDYDKTMHDKGLEKFKNIHYLGVKKYPILPKYAVWFDVATIPFVLNKITESTSPIKIFEYMALGKPIITTDLRECRKYKSVLIGKDYEDFIEKIDRALKLRGDSLYLELLDKEAKENTWEYRARKIDEAIQEHYNLSSNILNYKSTDWFKEIIRCQEEVATLCTNPYYKTNYQQEEALYWLNIPKWIDEDCRLNNVASILDIGCGYGALLFYAMRKYNCEAFAIDFTDAYLSKEIIAKYGIKFEINNIELNPFPWRKTFDRIIFTEVLEHLNFNPLVTLKKLNTLLSNNGKLFLSTPDAKKWGRIKKYYRTINEMPDPKPNTQIIDDHVYIYSKKELKNVLERSGFKIEKFDYSPGVSARHFNVMAVKK